MKKFEKAIEAIVTLIIIGLISFGLYAALMIGFSLGFTM